MAIIYVSLFTDWGGLPIHTEKTVAELARDGQEVSVIHLISGAENETAAKLSRFQFPPQVTQHVVTATSGRIGFSTLFEIAGILRRFKRPSCVFSKGFLLQPGEYTLIVLLRLLSRHLTLIFHTEVPAELKPGLSSRWKGATLTMVRTLRTWQMKLRYWTISWFPTQVVCVSRECAKRLAKIQASQGSRIVFSPNGVDCERFTLKDRAPHSVFTFGMMGRLTEVKSIPLAISAFHSLLQTKPGLDAQLLIYGEGELKSELQRAIERLGVGDRVKLMGYSTTPESVYPQFDAYLLTSHTEVSPLSLLEAMACGAIPIASRVGDVENMVESRFTFESGSEKALVEKMKVVAEMDIESRKNLGRQLRAHVEMKYNAAETYRKLAKIITHN